MQRPFLYVSLYLTVAMPEDSTSPTQVPFSIKLAKEDCETIKEDSECPSATDHSTAIPDGGRDAWFMVAGVYVILLNSCFCVYSFFKLQVVDTILHIRVGKIRSALMDHNWEVYCWC